MKPPKPTSLPTPSGVRVAPDIPTLKKKKEEEKKGGAGALPGGGASGAATESGGSWLSRLFGGGGRGGVGLGRGAASTVARSGIGVAGKLGFGPMLVNFLASNMAAVLFTGLVTGGAVYTLYSLGMSASAERPAKKSVFAVSDDGKAGETGEARVDASGLSYFQTANSGAAFGNEAVKTSDAPADKTSDAPATQDAPPPVADPGAAPGGSGPQIADALAKTLEKPKMIASRGPAGGGLGAGNGLAGGSGLSGGMMKKFDPKGTPINLATPPMKRDTQAKLAARRVSPIARANGAMNQLKATNGMSRKALGQTSGESQSFQAAEAFNTAPVTQGSHDLAGKGMGDGGAGASPGASDDGGPIARTGTEAPPDTGKKEDKTPYGKQLMMAQALLMTASAIITVIGILAIIKKMPIIGIIAEMWQKILYGAAIAMAASASAIGAMVMQNYGQKDQGMMVTIGGGITAAAATAALAIQRPEAAWISVLGGIAGLGASIGSSRRRHHTGPHRFLLDQLPDALPHCFGRLL